MEAVLGIVIGGVVCVVLYIIRTARLTSRTAEGAVEISLQRALIDRMRQAVDLR